MCGLCGVVGPERRTRIDDLEAMGRTLSHRGPDDFGVWQGSFAADGTAWEVGLAHTRLSILDVSPAGHQPMASGDGAVVVVYNGEIYNFLDLRAELEARGHRFRSRCDTEVLIEAWRAWGPDAFGRLVGMFAFALWDAARKQLVLVRDRLGIKPLYWASSDDGELAFASELGALRARKGFPAVVDPQALGAFLRHGYVPGPRTIYRDVHKLMPGEMLVWEAGRVRTEAWWRLTAAPLPPPDRFEAAVDGLEELLGDAVEQRLIADVPLGAFLSGGVDSSAVVALMRQRASAPVRTFSIGFRDASYDEAPHARAVARHLKTDHTELYVDEGQAVEVAVELPRLYDEPFADASALPTVLLSRLTRRHVTVALSGDGGDELFGGYWQYRKLRRLLPLMRLPRALRLPVARAARLLPGGGLRNGLAHLEAPDRARLALALVSACDESGIAAACGSEAAAPNPVYLETFRQAPAGDDVQRAMMADARVYLADDILTKVDRASMSVGLEARVPILDHRVVRFAFSLPLAFYWHGGRTKAPLRAVLHRHVPPALIERPKHGFGLPLGRLLAPQLRDWRARFLAPARLREEGHLAPEGVDRLLAEGRRRGGARSETAMLWRLLCFQRWWACHHRGEEPA